MTVWMKSVFSDMVSEVGWDDESGELIVVFKKNGARYAYANVPEDVAIQLSKAPSVGQMMIMDIKPFYSYRKI